VDVVEGLIAGALAAWAMGKVTGALYEREAQAAREREDRARHGRIAYGVFAEKLARAAGTRLSKQNGERWGARIHWALGIGTAVLYAAMRERLVRLGPARGLTYGVATDAALWRGAPQSSGPL
jgi:hypothetical protein